MQEARQEEKKEEKKKKGGLEKNNAGLEESLNRQETRKYQKLRYTREKRISSDNESMVRVESLLKEL